MKLRQVTKETLIRCLPSSAYEAVHQFVAVRDIVSGRRYEPEIDVIRQFVKSGDTVIDVGANHGLYSYNLSRFVGHSGTVYAYEPIPANLRILRRVAASTRNVVVRPSGCGERAHVAEFFVPAKHRIQIGGWAHRAIPSDDAEGVRIAAPVVTLDSEITRPISFIKCDIEGAELLAFQGAERILAQSKPVVLCEIFEPWCSRFGITKDQVLSFFRSRGYRVQQLSADNFLLLPSP